MNVESVTVCTGMRLNADLVKEFPDEWEFDPEWTWVAMKDGEQVGFLLGAPCHGVVLMIMVKAVRDDYCILGFLLRTFLRDSLARGFKGYMVHLNHDSPKQFKLKRIAQKAGAKVLPQRIIAVAGRLCDAARW